MRIGDTALARVAARALHGDAGEAERRRTWPGRSGRSPSLREAAGDLRQRRRAEGRRRADRRARRRAEAASSRWRTSPPTSWRTCPSPRRSTSALRDADPGGPRGVGAARRASTGGWATRASSPICSASVVDYVEDAAERGRLRLERVRTMVDGLGLDDARAAPSAARDRRRGPEPGRGRADAGRRSSSARARATSSPSCCRGRSTRRRIAATPPRSRRSRCGSASSSSRADRAEARNVYYTGLDWEPKQPRAPRRAPRDCSTARATPGERADVLEKRLAAGATDPRPRRWR